jgi:hypothetical protein
LCCRNPLAPLMASLTSCPILATLRMLPLARKSGSDNCATYATRFETGWYMLDSCESGESCSTCSLPKEEITHHETGAELEESFKNGCHMCTHLWCSFVHKTGRPYDVQLLRSAGRVWLTPISFWLLGWEAHIQVKGEEWVGEELHLRRSRRYQPSGASSSSSSGGCYETSKAAKRRTRKTRTTKSRTVKPTQGRVVTRAQLAALSHTRTASTASFDLVKGWMRQCTESHPRCKERPACALPRRLLRVFYEVTEREAVRIVRLVDTDSLPAADMSGSDLQYAALSYCWGRTTPFTLTASSEQVLRDGVPIDQLHKTIQHAAYTTLKLDIEWLWVDSLCISRTRRRTGHPRPGQCLMYTKDPTSRLPRWVPRTTATASSRTETRSCTHRVR